MSTTATTAAQKATPVAKEMSFLDRWLPVWILAAMAVGLLLGRFVPGLDTALDAVKIGGISVPIALGLLVMMYPVLAKVAKRKGLPYPHVNQQGEIEADADWWATMQAAG